MLNFISSMTLKRAIQLGIPDIIHNHGQPGTLPQLASVLQIDPNKTDLHYLGFHGRLVTQKDLTPFELACGMDFWHWINQNPEARKQFDKTMDNDSKVISLALKDCKSVFEGLSSIVDVGGGTGTVAKTISEAFPHLKCTVLDLPNVVANLTGSENLNFVGGGMSSYPSC
ncbi:putative O-methyltransferase [Quillaja saponaria]|uniref:O-methyltransferase n=1 Tax=Quillaja saponaria TaxID=32244 RepID=A0AAD7KWS4_QUISA|nr:putative O-methyltransferase [Quillaja saponaria]